MNILCEGVVEIRNQFMIGLFELCHTELLNECIIVYQEKKIVYYFEYVYSLSPIFLFNWL
jgi:hypothetical protein